MPGEESGGGGLDAPALGRAQAFGIFLFVHGIDAAEDGAGFPIGQVDRAQVPGSETQPEFLQMAEAGRDFKTNAFQRERAIAAALSAPDLRGKGQLELLGGRTRLADILMVQKALQGSLADLRVDLAVVFQLDPRLADFVELVQSQIGHPFEHGQQPPLNLAPKDLLLAILVRANMAECFQRGRPGA